MNEKEKKLAEKIGVAIEEIWTNYYTEEGIRSGDIEPHAAVQYERLIDNIAEIIYRTGKSNKVHKIEDLGAFEKRMKEIYPTLQSICPDGIEECDDGKHEIYVAWLKFPYYSTDSDGGFFVFYTEKEFTQSMASSICMFTEEQIKEEQFEVEQYTEFYNAEHKPVFDLNKALYLYYKANIEKYTKLFNEKEDKKMNSEEFSKYLDENLPKVKFEEPKVFKVAIEEHINQIFEVEAADMEEAMELAKERYYKGEYVLEGDVNVSARLVSAEDDNGDFVNWYEF